MENITKIFIKNIGISTAKSMGRSFENRIKNWLNVMEVRFEQQL